ncbi:hypothetical protein BDV59DRAFT_173830 [Aspergillus ambiguus]|uniref:uncharacterized protein n=1 Tax=Aspergillus ambiguus TaxID=176160 RepID=UPI003CCCB088
MAVTELAILHLKNAKEISPEIKSTLVSGASAQASFSRYPVRLYTQIEDPSYIYLLGGWDSVSQHMDEWIPSPTNQNVMSALLNEMEVFGMFHIDAEPQSEERNISRDAPIMTLKRYIVEEAKKAEFGTAFTQLKDSLEDHTAPRTLRCGWRIDYPKDRNGMFEFIFLSDGENIGERLLSLETDGFKSLYVDDTSDGAIRYVRLLEST